MKTTACSDVADYVWLTGDEACAILVDLADDHTPLHSLTARLRRSFTAPRTHLLLEQVELRRRAKVKFENADRMFFTRIGLEQATDQWVAAYKASRVLDQRAAASARLSLSNAAPTRVIADLCCGIGGDLTALATGGSAIGIDLDPIAAHFAAINSGQKVHKCDVEEFDFANVTAWHIDPDRRPTGKRTTSLDFSTPNGETINRIIQRAPNAAIKLAPATIVPPDWVDRCELEWISRDRECRQLVAWHGGLAQHPGKRRATILPAAASTPVRSLIGMPKLPVTIAKQPDRFIFDIDSAVLAAHLKGALAAEHGLSALGRGPTYLTGPKPIHDAALACFEVVEVLPLETRKLARMLQARGIGKLEIKKRGVEIQPEKLRRDLKLRGNNTATLLLAQIADRSVAILAHRCAD